MADYDVIVIGAGNGGLTAGAQLSARGARVLVLEQHNLPGGFASSFVRGRFEFEPSLHELCDVGPAGDKGGVRKLLEDDLGVEVDFVRVPEAYRMILTTENLDVTMPFGIEEFADAVDGYVPGSRAAVRSYLDLCREVLDALNYLGASKGNPDKKVLLKQHGKIWRGCTGGLIFVWRGRMPGNIFQGVAQLQIFDPDREMALTIWVKIWQQDF